MNTVSIIFAIVSCLSLILLTLSFVLSRYTRKDGTAITLPSILSWAQHEAVAMICFVFFISFSVLSVHAAVDKCVNCHRTVTSAYCIYCGEKNDDYTSSLNGKNICPECILPCDTPYCGDCGTQTIIANK